MTYLRSDLKSSMQGLFTKIWAELRGLPGRVKPPLAKAGRHRIWRNKEGKQCCQNPRRAVAEAEDHIPGAGNWWSKVLEVRGRITSRGGRSLVKQKDGKRVVEGWEAWKRRERKLENLFQGGFLLPAERRLLRTLQEQVWGRHWEPAFPPQAGKPGRPCRSSTGRNRASVLPFKTTPDILRVSVTTWSYVLWKAGFHHCPGKEKRRPPGLYLPTW